MTEDKKPLDSLKVTLTVLAFLSAIFATMAQDAVWAIIWFFMGSINLVCLRAKTKPPTNFDWWVVRVNLGMAGFCTFAWMVVYFMGIEQANPGLKTVACLFSLVYFILRLVEDKRAEEA